MTRRCSHCSNNGHNSRTCPTRAGGGGVRLFGVRISEGGGGGGPGAGAMKKSASMGSLSQYASLAPSASRDRNGSPASSDLAADHAEGDAAGYASDDPNHASCSSNRRGERKKGTPWTEDEHRLFLLGLQKLGKGDWRGIARNYVVTRTPTQVASHAQKYFIRQSNATRRKRRSSLFDMVPDMPGDQSSGSFMQRSASETDIANSLPSLDLTLELEPSSTDQATDKPVVEPKERVPCADLPPLVPTFYPPYFPRVPYPFWPSVVPTPVKEEDATGEVHEVLKPTPVLAKGHSHSDELVGLSKLSIGDAVANRIEPSPLSSKLLSPSSTRQSAFHVNMAATGADLSLNNGSVIHAV